MPLAKTLPLFGASLEAAIDATPEIRPALIEGLVLEESVTMVAAEGGKGKSTVLLSMVVPACAGLLAFGSQKVNRPLRVYVFCPERSARELRERLGTIRKFIPYNPINLAIDDGMVGIVDISNPLIVDEIKTRMRIPWAGDGPDLFCVEGMYGMTRLPLAKEETANLFYRFNSMLIQEFKCSVWYSTHCKKRQQNYKGEDLELQYFGSTFLLANVTAAYIFERMEQKNRSRMKQFKDTVSGLADELIFQYDPERSVLETVGAGNSKEALRQFINSSFANGGTFRYDDAEHVTHLSRSALMNLLAGQVADGNIINVNAKGIKALYRVLRPS